jgi:hypothetical protein
MLADELYGLIHVPRLKDDNAAEECVAPIPCNSDPPGPQLVRLAAFRRSSKTPRAEVSLLPASREKRSRRLGIAECRSRKFDPADILGVCLAKIPSRWKKVDSPYGTLRFTSRFRSIFGPKPGFQAPSDVEAGSDGSEATKSLHPEAAQRLASGRLPTGTMM